jgi:protein-tyrosine sulfotransferase
LNSGLTQQKLDNAMRLFIYYIMNEHIRPAERLCAKDPNILYYIEYLHKLYPNAKFIWLVRDPRAVVFSLLGLYREGLNMANAKKYFITWQQYNKKVKRDCDSVGSSRCIMVKYEDLILAPKETIGKVASFLNLEWTDDFLRREIKLIILFLIKLYFNYFC